MQPLPASQCMMLISDGPHCRVRVCAYPKFGVHLDGEMASSLPPLVAHRSRASRNSTPEHLEATCTVPVR